MHGLLVAAALALAPIAANAQGSRWRATIPGSLHQCENTNMFFFDSDGSRPLTVLFVDPSDVPSSAQSGTIQLSDAAGYNPLQVIQGIDTPDAQQFNFELDMQEGQVFEVLAFGPDGSGKAMSLTRTVTTALPGAQTSCWTGAQTTVSGVDARTSSSSSSSSSSRRTSSSRTSSSPRTSSSSNSVSGVSPASSSSSSSSSARQTSSSSSQSSSASSRTRSTSTTQATITAAATGVTAAGSSDPAQLSSIPNSGASANTGKVVMTGMLVLVGSIAAFAML